MILWPHNTVARTEESNQEPPHRFVCVHILGFGRWADWALGRSVEQLSQGGRHLKATSSALAWRLRAHQQHRKRAGERVSLVHNCLQYSAFYCFSALFCKSLVNSGLAG